MIASNNQGLRAFLRHARDGTILRLSRTVSLLRVDDVPDETGLAGFPRREVQVSSCCKEYSEEWYGEATTVCELPYEEAVDRRCELFAFGCDKLVQSHPRLLATLPLRLLIADSCQ